MVSCLKHQLLLTAGALQAVVLGRTLYAGARSSTPWHLPFSFSPLIYSSETSCGKLIWSSGARRCMKNLVWKESLFHKAEFECSSVKICLISNCKCHLDGL